MYAVSLCVQNESAMDENGVAAAIIPIATTFCRVIAILLESINSLIHGSSACSSKLASCRPMSTCCQLVMWVVCTKFGTGSRNG